MYRELHLQNCTVEHDYYLNLWGSVIRVPQKEKEVLGKEHLMGTSFKTV
jgi:hypothetical protein